MSIRVLLIPGGTAIGAVALAHAGLHKILELAQERRAEPNHPAPHTVVVLRDPGLVPPATLRGAACDPVEVFPQFADVFSQDSSFFDGVDLVVETSGSTTGVPRHVGLSVEAIEASIDMTHEVLDGPGAWILALPAHHIAGAMVLLRSTRHDFPPRIVDTSQGFRPESLIPAVRGALSHGGPAYLSLVPAQLRKVLEHPEACAAVASLNAVLIGGQAVSSDLVDLARRAGIAVHASYGMSETCGGVVYDGRPLPGVEVRVVDGDSLCPLPVGVQGRVAIASPTLMTGYLEGGEPWLDLDGQRFLLTNDWGFITESGELSVVGRIDDIVITGGEKVFPSEVEGVIRRFPGVVDVWVGGVDDERWGSVVSAVVVLGDTRGGVCDELYEWVRARLGRFAAPRLVAVVDELPLLGSGKVDRLGCVALLDEARRGGRVWER